jgi:hypothetical protein
MSKLRIPPIRKDNKKVVCTVSNTDEKVDERHLRHWIVKVLVLTLAVLTVFVVLTFLYLSVTGKSSIKESTVGIFIQTLSEIIKIILTPM